MVAVALDGQTAPERAAVYPYDVVVLDRDLPMIHGDEVCRRLIADGSTSRVLMSTAAGRIEDRVDGLELGAGDYLPEPCAFTELIARIRALCRRSGPPLPTILACADLRLDLTAYCIPNWYHFGMSKQIAVRLPDELVEFVDEVVGSGQGASRAAVVTRALERERRRMVALRDVEILTSGGPDPELAGLAGYAAGVRVED